MAETHAPAAQPQAPAASKHAASHLLVSTWLIRPLIGGGSPRADEPSTPTRESSASHAIVLRSQDSYDDEADYSCSALPALPAHQQQHQQQPQPSQQHLFQPTLLQQQGQQRQWTATSQAIAVLVACMSWVFVSSATILINKHIMVDLSFHFPAAVAALGMTGTTLASFLACCVLRLVPCKASVTPYYFFTRIMTTGFFMALSFQAGNTAYLYLSVAFVQMLKAFTPVSTMVCSFAFGLERASARLVAAVGCICLGVVVSSYGELNFSVFGVAAMLTSIAAEGLRTCMMQHLLASKQFHPLEAWLYLGPACTVWLLLLIGVSEAQQILDQHALRVAAAHGWYFAFAALAGFAVNGLAMLVIKLASALTLKVLGICKDIGLVALGVMLLGERVAGLQVAGYGISLMGFAYYNALKAMSLGAPAPAAAEGAAPAAAKKYQQQQQKQDRALGGAGGASKAAKLAALPAAGRGAGAFSSGGSRGSSDSSTSSLIGTDASCAAGDLTQPLLLHVVVPPGIKKV